MIQTFLQRRRATAQLAQALAHADLPGVEAAIAAGANLAKVKDTFDWPAMHFQTSYVVQGAVQLAIEHRASAELFAVLMDRGAPVPMRADGSLDAAALFAGHDDQRWGRSSGLADYLGRRVIERAGGHTVDGGPSQARRSAPRP